MIRDLLESELDGACNMVTIELVLQPVPEGLEFESKSTSRNRTEGLSLSAHLILVRIAKIRFQKRNIPIETSDCFELNLGSIWQELQLNNMDDEQQQGVIQLDPT
ncbi:hypothetical protein GJ496_001819 [Pomphorhynchus laevis]|nr:hypothetical protein GJ496_001819 [Pomphorhynchus laevis]